MSKKSNQPLSQEQQEAIIGLFADGESKRAIAKNLGISDSTVRKYLEKHGCDAFAAASEPSTGAPLSPYISFGRQIARQAETIRELRKQAKAVNERGFGFDDFIEEMKRVVAVEKTNPFTYYPTQIKAAKALAPVPAIDPNHSEVACLALSDWHITEVVKLSDSNGVNVYNTMIGSNRVWGIVQKFKQVLGIHRAAFKVKKIWLTLLGDMLSGSIHPEFPVTNDMTDQSAVVLVYRLIVMVIEELKSLGISIEIDAVCGNHPRTTLKLPTKDMAHTNLDWLVYMLVEARYQEDPQVKVTVHTSQIALVEQFDFRYVLEHGVDYKNGKEEDMEDRLRALFDDAIYRKATGMKGSSFDHIVIGNLHKGAFLERMIKNASLIGQNELGQQWRLRPIRAQQAMWGISRSHVRTFTYGLDVTDVKSSNVENPFSEFAREYLRDHGKYQLQ